MNAENNTEFSNDVWEKATAWRDVRSLAGLGYICDGDLAALLRQILPHLSAADLAKLVPNVELTCRQQPAQEE